MKNKTRSHLTDLILIMLVVVLFNIDMVGDLKADESQKLSAETYEKLVNAWSKEYDSAKAERKNVLVPSRYFVKNQKYYEEIVSYKLNAIPHIVRHMKQEGHTIKGGYLNGMLITITKKRFTKEELMRFIHEKIDTFYEYLQWWEKDRFLSETEFIERYERWGKEPPDLKKKRPHTVDLDKELGTDPSTGKDAYLRWCEMPNGPEKEKLRPFIRTEYQNLLDLGIGALPFAIEKIREGDADSIDAIHYWTDDALKKSAKEKGIPADRMREYCVKWWEENKEDWLYPPIEKQE